MDILIRNGLVLDGTGAHGKKADVAIRDGRIRAVGGDLRGRADQVIDAEGSVVAPGFVDILNHSDAYLTLLKNPASQSLLAQGITTVVIGNCGASLAPITHGRLISVIQKWADIRSMNVDWERFREFLQLLDRFKPGVNVAGLVGHATLRRAVLGDEAREVTESELAAMVALLEGALDEGAFGLSFAPFYTHARTAPEWEIDALAQTLSRKGGYLAVHLRDEGPGIFEAFEEAFGIAHRAKLPLQISHLKAIGEEAEKQLSSILEKINSVQSDETPVDFDVFPWQTSLTVLYTLFPQWAQEGGLAAMRKRLHDRTVRTKIVEEMKASKTVWTDYVVAEGHRNQTAVGKSIVQLAQIMGVSPEEAAANLFVAHEGRVLLFRRGGSRRMLLETIKHPHAFIASAGGGYAAEDENLGSLVHPRSFGTTARVLGKLVRTEKILPLEVAVAKMSGRPARKIGLHDRGTIVVGSAADIVIFDAEQIQNRATLTKPYRYPSGIQWVFVNGVAAVNPDGLTGSRAGTALYREKKS